MIVYAAMPRRPRSKAIFAAALAAALAAAAGPARAEEGAQVAEARTLFTRGSDLYLAKQYASALEALRASYRLVPSPNSGLLVARCLRELDRSVEASEMYAVVEAAARQRVAAGDAKYGQTAAAAASEGAAVRAQLGTIRIRVRHAPSGTQIEIDDASTALPADGALDALHERGAVTVRVRPPAGVAQSQIVDLAPGRDVTMEFELGPERAAIAPSVAPPAPAVVAPGTGEWSRGWARPAAWWSGGITLAGAGVFVGFGLDSQTRYDDLKRRCGPASCGPGDRADADAGKRAQLVADIGLAVGAAAAAATIGFVILSITDHRAVPSRAAARFVAALSGVPF